MKDKNKYICLSIYLVGHKRVLFTQRICLTYGKKRAFGDYLEPK